MSSTALCDGPQQPKWPRRKTIHPTAQAGWYTCARYRENRRYGTSSIKQDEEGGTRSLLALPFKLHVKLCSSTSHSSVLSVVVQPVWQRPSGEGLATSRQLRAALGQRLIIWVPVVVSTCSSPVLPAKKKTGLIYLTFQRIREKKKSFKKGKIEFGNFIPRRVGNGSRALTLRLSPRPQHS